MKYKFMLFSPLFLKSPVSWVSIQSRACSSFVGLQEVAQPRGSSRVRPFHGPWALLGQTATALGRKVIFRISGSGSLRLALRHPSA